MAFNPAEHLRKINGGADYLEVKWRLVWFRDEWPHGGIETGQVEITDQRAVFWAKVTQMNEAGDCLGYATGYGSETPKDFRDYIEKAETKAIGRALAALGYGTQFAPELEEGERIVDSPVQRPQKEPEPIQPVNLDDASFTNLANTAGTDPAKWKRLIGAAGTDTDRWQLLFEKAPNDAIKKRLDELQPTVNPLAS